MSETVPESGVSIEQAVEAVLLTSDKSIRPAQIADALTEALGQPVDADQVREAAKLLNEAYETTGRAFTIETVASGLRMMARPQLAGVLASYHGQRASNRLSRAALETLAIVAYRQPVTRAEIENIRGVACGEVLRSLMDRRLVTIAGRAEELGRPMLYGTTRDFLMQFGLGSIKDLPEMTDPQAVKAVRVRSDSETLHAETADEQSGRARDESALETTQS
ncbi:MAG: SMC-Scp complex subunit ScpB [Phycisphaerales bacterium]|nr:SMC-Scp complex subunit ScpB [Phycisphaerales bacterium]MCB9836208.1 SMC-Scp complex subunit ScpB [Phycisphaera sp.]